MRAMKLLRKRKWHGLRPGVWIAGLILTGLSGYVEAEGPSAGTLSGKDDGANSRTEVANLYKQTGTDPSFQSLLDDGRIPAGKSSKNGVKGSLIDVNNSVVERGANGGNAIPNDIRIHTLCNSGVARKDFPKWTRWYQEDSHTQVFRLFKGETNVHNQRALAARVEAFSGLNWQFGEWHEWSGTYTIVKPHGCSIFQAKNNISAWGVMINLTDDGNIVLNHRRHQKDVVLARNMTGKSFDLKVRDNGRDYEVYFNGKKVGSGYFNRPEGRTCFRWGMYLGEHEVLHEAMIFVTGAKFK